MSRYLIQILALLVVLIAGHLPSDADVKLPKNCIQIGNSGDRIICVCNEQYCDTYDYDWPAVPGQSYLLTSSEEGLRFLLETLPRNNSSPENSDNSTLININLKLEHQNILGWGGAFTDATGINVKSLTEEVGDKLMASYFSKNGLGYNFGRVPIGGSDFSTRAYSYDDTAKEDDYDLSEWSLDEADLKYKIPLLKRALDLVGATNETLRLFGSPWSPPEWMKDNRNFTRGHLIDDDRIYRSYAAYIVKFYNAYKEHGLNFWGGTLQNEPWCAITMPNYSFNSLELVNSQAIKFIGDFLGPELESNGYTKENFKLMIGDDNLGLVNNQVPSIMFHDKVKKYVSGFAFHWYSSVHGTPYSEIQRVIDPIRDDLEFVLMTEACNGFMPSDIKVDLGSWDRGQKYAIDIIQDLLHQSAGWIDWNMALDQQGGPNWVENFVDSPIIVNKVKNEFYKQPMYYVLGHFSRHFRPGSRRIETSIDHRILETTNKDELMAVAAHDKRGEHLVLNILNLSDQTKMAHFSINGTEYTIPPVQLAKKSISTIILKL